MDWYVLEEAGKPGGQAGGGPAEAELRQSTSAALLAADTVLRGGGAHDGGVVPGLLRRGRVHGGIHRSPDKDLLRPFPGARACVGEGVSTPAVVDGVVVRPLKQIRDE